MLIGVVLACTAAAHASATPAPGLFEVRIVANGHAEWDHTGLATASGACERTVRSEGFRDVRFRTAKPTVVRVASGRVLPATVRGLTGTVVLSGANTLSDVCGLETKEEIQDCATTRRSFRSATVGLSSRRAGSITLGRPGQLRLRTINCPREPGAVVRTPLGPIPRRLSTAALANPRVRHLTLSASASRRTEFGPSEQGTLEQRSAWKLTFDRVQP